MIDNYDNLLQDETLEGRLAADGSYYTGEYYIEDEKTVYLLTSGEETSIKPNPRSCIVVKDMHTAISSVYIIREEMDTEERRMHLFSLFEILQQELADYIDTPLMYEEINQMAYSIGEINSNTQIFGHQVWINGILQSGVTFHKSSDEILNVVASFHLY